MKSMGARGQVILKYGNSQHKLQVYSSSNSSICWQIWMCQKNFVMKPPPCVIVKIGENISLLGFQLNFNHMLKLYHHNQWACFVPYGEQSNRQEIYSKACLTYHKSNWKDQFLKKKTHRHMIWGKHNKTHGFLQLFPSIHPLSHGTVAPTLGRPSSTMGPAAASLADVQRVGLAKGGRSW